VSSSFCIIVHDLDIVPLELQSSSTISTPSSMSVMDSNEHSLLQSMDTCISSNSTDLSLGSELGFVSGLDQNANSNVYDNNNSNNQSNNGLNIIQGSMHRLYNLCKKIYYCICHAFDGNTNGGRNGRRNRGRSILQSCTLNTGSFLKYTPSYSRSHPQTDFEAIDQDGDSRDSDGNEMNDGPSNSGSENQDEIEITFCNDRHQNNEGYVV
jgi:hypothetical protein